MSTEVGNNFVATVLLNGAEDAARTGFLHGDPLFHDYRTVLDLTADSVGSALDLAVNIGTGEGHDDEGRRWRQEVRPVEVGDVVYVARAKVCPAGTVRGWQEEGYFSVSPTGYTRLYRNPGCTYGVMKMSMNHRVALAA